MPSPRPARKRQPAFSPVEEVIADIAAGKLVIVADDEERENEGDLIGAAEKITPRLVAFMAREGAGMLCVPVSMEIARRLELETMVPHNREAFKTHFTVTVDAAHGISTGISAADRARTIQLLAGPASRPSDLVRPGHVSPLIAKPGGVLRRAGHTEAAVDLARMAGLSEAGVLIEIMNRDGTMARLPHLKKFAHKHRLKLCSIEDMIAYRRHREKLVELVEVVDMPTEFGVFKLHLYKTALDDLHHVALVKGRIDPAKPILVRVHSECLTGDIFSSRRCDCGNQLHAALRKIAESESGVLLYMRGHEGRGIGLHAKIRAYKLQEQGYDTVDANLKLGYASDLRDYGMGAQILYDLGARQLRLMTNNPRKVVGLEGHKLTIVERVPVKADSRPENARYLDTKKKRLGHLL
ncbi:MAG: bifunctional 3,4-dihydroxy-2-butanone-4-phosphate synthase/GTP cyclohydrolase II [Verrucomicrobiales bacterium]